MNQGSTPNDHELTNLALDLIREQKAMTLATAEGNTPWAAPVYYVYHKTAFYFFSNPQSRHIVQASTNHAVSAAIHPYVDTWQRIQGLQMSGGIHSVGSEIAAIQPVGAYIKKFPFTAEFFESRRAPDLGSFAKRFKVKFYRFEPDIVLYMDNRIRFGFRTEVHL